MECGSRVLCISLDWQVNWTAVEAIGTVGVAALALVLSIVVEVARRSANKREAKRVAHERTLEERRAASERLLLMRNVNARVDESLGALLVLMESLTKFNKSAAASGQPQSQSEIDYLKLVIKFAHRIRSNVPSEEMVAAALESDENIELLVNVGRASRAFKKQLDSAELLGEQRVIDGYWADISKAIEDKCAELARVMQSVKDRLNPLITKTEDDVKETKRVVASR